MNRILLFAPNWLGDAVMALPAIADLRRAHAGARIAVAARPSVAPLFELVREVDETRVIGGARRGVDKGDELALLLPNSFHSALVAYRAGIPERWGYRADGRSPLLTRAVARPRGLHQVAYYQHLVAALGIANGPRQPRIDLPSDRAEPGRALVRDAGWDGRAPLVALAAGAAYGGAKRWPPAFFGALARELAGDGIVPVLVGGNADASTGREVVAAAQPVRVVDLIGRTSLGELAGILTACRAVVSNDSGAMHFAAALGVRLTAIFGPTDDTATAPIPSRRVEAPSTGGPHGGPTADDPRVTADDRRPTTVIVHPVWCRPCMLRECPLDHACMRGVRVADVHRATIEALR